MDAMGAQNALGACKRGLQASQESGPGQPPQGSGRRRDRDIDMSGKFWLPAHI
jgi:hypothetical protein